MRLYLSLLLASSVIAHRNLISVSWITIGSLEALYNSTDGPQWNWKDPSIYGPKWSFDPADQQDPCADTSLGTGVFPWQGVTCSLSISECVVGSCAVIAVTLNNYSLSGSLPSEFFSNFDLVNISMESNSLTGSLPHTIFDLSSLRTLNLQENFLTGGLSSQLGNLISITELSLSRNELNGPLPSEIGSLSALQILRLGDNGFTSFIPPVITAISSLVHLELGAAHTYDVIGYPPNQLNGIIPTNIGQLTMLNTLILGRNRLTGSIPENISNMFHLKGVYLGDNLIRGNIPDIGSLKALQYLHFEENLIEGQIPSSLSQLSELIEVNLRNNLLSGFLPVFSSVKLSSIDFSFNSLGGSIPSAIGNVLSLRFLSLSRNAIGGNIPSELFLLHNISGILLDDNEFTGAIPSEIGFAVKLQNLYLDNNALTGMIPSSVASLTELVDFNLDNNKLTGTIPQGIFRDMPNLKHICLHHNAFYGQILDNIFLNTGVSTIQIQNNKFSGTIPTVMPYAVSEYKLATLDIGENRFSGTFPVSLFEMPQLEHFIASSNCFSGELPVAICSASMLRVLSMNGLSSGKKCSDSLFAWLPGLVQGFEGTIPNCIFSHSSLQSLYLAGNGFYGSLGPLAPDSKLRVLVVSHGHITNNIPDSYLTGQFQYLDISHNMINGEIEAFAMPESIFFNEISPKYIFKENRISGHVPPALRDANASIEILAGNHFACPPSELPQSDPDIQEVVCGSFDLDVALIIMGVALFALTLWICRTYIPFLKLPQSVIQRHRDVLLFRDELINYDSEVPEMVFLMESMRHITHVMAWLLVPFLFVLMPAYAIMKVNNGQGMYQYQYSWLFTAAMLSGEAPAVCVFVVWMAIIIALFFDFVVRRHREESAHMSSVLSQKAKAKETLRESVLDRLSDAKNRLKAVGEHYTKPLSAIMVAVYFTVDILFGVCINSIYVVLLRNNFSANVLIVIHIGVGMISLMWKALCVYAIDLELFSSISISSKSLILTSVFLVNSIILPVIVFIMADWSCFLVSDITI
jgi:Leucine-rich repeat (LRR) protein